MTFLSKVKWVLSILLVFFVVLTTNLIDKKHFDRLNYSVNTIYEDRMVSSDLLFELSLIIHKKEIALISEDSLFFKNQNEPLSQDLERLMERYAQNKMTEKERLYFGRLKTYFQQLKQLGNASPLYNDQKKKELGSLLIDINEHIYDLIKIQLEEGKRQVFSSRKAINAIDFFTQSEIIFLVIMAILVQIIILYRPTPAKDKDQEDSN